MLFSIPLTSSLFYFPNFCQVWKLQSLRLAAVAGSCLGGLAAPRKAEISRGTVGLVSSSPSQYPVMFPPFFPFSQS